MFESTSQARPESDDRYNNSRVHLITSNNKVRESSERTNPLVTDVQVWKDGKMGLIVGMPCRTTRSLSVGTHSSSYHYSNTERSIPAKRSVHNVPPDDTLTVAADDFLFPALALVLELGRAPDPLLEELPATVVCPEISEKNGYVVSPSP